MSHLEAKADPDPRQSDGVDPREAIYSEIVTHPSVAGQAHRIAEANEDPDAPVSVIDLQGSRRYLLVAIRRMSLREARQLTLTEAAVIWAAGAVGHARWRYARRAAGSTTHPRRRER